MVRSRTKSLGKFVACLLTVGIILPVHSLFAQDVTPEYCTDGLPEAQNQLFMGGFELAIALIEPCIEADSYSTTDELMQAYELLANVYIAVNDEEKARQAITSLLETDPDFEPDPDQSRTDFVFLVEEMRSLLTPSTPSIVSVTTEDLFNTINWSFETSTTISSFALYRGTNPNSLTLLTTLPFSVLTLSPGANNLVQTSFRDMDVAYSTRYYYAIEAIGENDNSSERSQVVDVLTPNQIAQPVADVDRPDTDRKKVSPWIFVGGGAVAGGLALLLIGNETTPPTNGGGGETGALPAPPPLP